MLAGQGMRIPHDSGSWEEEEPEDGLSQWGGDEADEEVEAAYAQEGLDRLFRALDDERNGRELLERLRSLVGAAGSSWQVI